MVYRGKVQNGQIILDGGARLPDGTSVQIEPVEAPQHGSVAAILASNAHWHGTDEELYALLAELKRSKQEELQEELKKAEPSL